MVFHTWYGYPVLLVQVPCPQCLGSPCSPTTTCKCILRRRWVVELWVQRAAGVFSHTYTPVIPNTRYWHVQVKYGYYLWTLVNCPGQNVFWPAQHLHLPPPLPDPSQFFARRLTLSHLHLHLCLCLHLCLHLCAATTSQHFCSGPFQWPRRLSPGFFPKEKPPSRFLVICLFESAQSHFWLQRSPTPPPLQSLNSLRVIKRLVSPARLSPYIYHFCHSFILACFGGL